MTRQELYARLCVYDPRNPNGAYSYTTPEDIKDLPQPMEKGCSCDPCCYGRSRLADFALDLLDELEIAQGGAA